jgi:WD40 repeat protein
LPAFSRDRRLVVTSSPDGRAFIRDLTTHKQRLLPSAVTAAAFSPDGKLVVTVSGDKTARIWDVATGDLLHTLVGHFAPLVDAEFSRDGQWVVTTTRRAVYLWSVTSSAATLGPQVLLTLPPKNDRLAAASFDGAGTGIDARDVNGHGWKYRCSVCEKGKALIGIAEQRLVNAGVEHPLTAACRRWISDTFITAVQPIGSPSSPCGEI